MKVNLFTLLGIPFYATHTALITAVLLAIIGALVGLLALDFDLVQAVILGVGVAFIHESGEVVHQLGHGIAARRIGKPMQSVILWGPLGTSIYPKDEVVSPRQHLQRAIGGPLISVILAIIFTALLFVVQGDDLIMALLAYTAFSYVVIFTLGALTPIHTLTGLPLETDGDTILKTIRQKD